MRILCWCCNIVVAWFCAIESVILPTTKNRMLANLLYLFNNPLSLHHSARRLVQQQLFVHMSGASIIAAAFTLYYPTILQQYLLLSDPRRCNIDCSSLHHCRYEIDCKTCATHFDMHTVVCCHDAMSQDCVFDSHASVYWRKYCCRRTSTQGIHSICNLKSEDYALHVLLHLFILMVIVWVSYLLSANL